MSTNPETTPSGPAPAARTPRQVDQAFENVARLSGSDLPPANYFENYLKEVLGGINAPAGAVWLRTPQGFLQLQCQTNIEHVGLDKHKNGRQSHNELLRQAFQTGKPIMLEPFGSTGIMEGLPAGNPTELVCLLAPIALDEKTAVGLVEVWQEPRYDARVQRTFLNYLVQMAGYASNYVRTQQGRQSLNQEQLWLQLEAFAAQIHSTLHPTEVAYHVANEGRRLIGCDRLSVAIRDGNKARIEAVSGADVVERRGTQMQLMRKLIRQVLRWGEKLVYRGQKDDGLPPAVLHALDEYLAESHAKLLIVQPIFDEREKEKAKELKRPVKARSALLMECFEPPAAVEPLISRLDIIGRHAVSALYNAVEMKKIPLRVLWKPVYAVQEGLGGKTRFLTILVATGLALLIAALVFIQYPLKLDAKGQLLPSERRYVYAPRDGTVRGFTVDTNSVVSPNHPLVVMFDPTLQQKLADLQSQIHNTQNTIESKRREITANNLGLEARNRAQEALAKAEIQRTALSQELTRLHDLYRTDRNRPGEFTVVAPRALSGLAKPGEAQWVVLSGRDFRETLLGRAVKPSDPLLRLGEQTGAWEVETKIPQKHVARVKAAFPKGDPNAELDVDLIVSTMPDNWRPYRGKLSLAALAGEVVPNRDEHNESEPVLVAPVRVSGDDIPEDQRIPPNLLTTGVEVRMKIRCGSHAMGYSLFYGLWEFVNEKVFFYLF